MLFTIVAICITVFLIYKEWRDEKLERLENIEMSDVLIPYSRLVSILDKESLGKFYAEIGLTENIDEFRIVVRKWAWSNGIDIDPKETLLMQHLLNGEELTDEEELLLELLSETVGQICIIERKK